MIYAYPHRNINCYLHILGHLNNNFTAKMVWMCEWLCVSVCVFESMPAWKYVLFVSSSTFKTTLTQKIPLCILTIWTTRNYWFYFQKTRFFSNLNSLSWRILLMLTSIKEILYRKKLCVCSLQNVQRERQGKKMPCVIVGKINSFSFLNVWDIFMLPLVITVNSKRKSVYLNFMKLIYYVYIIIPHY